MRKCLDCGKELTDIEMKCPECGSKNLSDIIMPQSDKPKISGKRLGIIAVSAAAVVVAICIAVYGAFLVIRNTQTEPVVRGVRASYLGNLDDYIAAYDESLQSVISSKAYQTEDAENFQSNQEELLKSAYGDDYKVYVNAVAVKDCSQEIVDTLNYNYADYNLNIEQAKYVTVTVYTKGSTGETFISRTVYSVRINGKWSMFEDFLTD